MKQQQQELEKLTNTRFSVILGFLVIILFALAFVAWGGLVPISTAAIAPGMVGVEGYKKRIQHLHAGVVKSIHVRNGDRVDAGETLLELDDFDVQTKTQELQNLIVQLGVEQARLTAEQKQLVEIEFPEWLLTYADRTQITSALATEETLFVTRKQGNTDARRAIEHQMQSANVEADAASTRVVNLQSKQALIKREMAEFKRLEKRGLVTRSRLFELENQMSNLRLELDQSQSEIKIALQEHAELKAKLAQLENNFQQDVTAKLNTISKQLGMTKQELSTAERQLAQTRIRTPIGGIVHNSTINTEGGVILPGSTLMEIIPITEKLTIESQLAAQDRDAVEIGQKAEIRFRGLNQRTTPPLQGVVKIISADTHDNQNTGSPYYQTTIELVDDPQEILGETTLHPGMQADVLILTGRQTFLEYLTSPVSRSFNRAFREN